MGESFPVPAHTFPRDYRVKRRSSSCHCSSLQHITATEKVHQCKQDSIRPLLHEPRTFPSPPCARRAPWPPWMRKANCRIPTKISSLLPEFPALFFPLVIFVSCKQQTQRHSHATLLHIGHQWDQRRFNLLFPAHSIFYLTYQKEQRQTLKNVPQ